MYSHQPPQIAFLSLSKVICFSQKDFESSWLFIKSRDQFKGHDTIFLMIKKSKMRKVYMSIFDLIF